MTGPKDDEEEEPILLEGDSWGEAEDPDDPDDPDIY